MREYAFVSRKHHLAGFRMLPGIVLLAVVGLPGCSTTSTDSTEGSITSATAVRTTPESAATTAVMDADPCSPSGSQSLINSLAVATQQGDATAAARLFADGDNFEWFSATSSVDHYVTYDPAVLEDRFRQRFRDGEQFELVVFNWNGPIQSGNLNFDFEMTWTNPDLANEPGDAWGKGAIDCADASIIVWSLAMKPLGPGPTRNG